MAYSQDMGGYTCSADYLPNAGPRHQHVAQCCRDIQPFFSKCLGIHKVCLGFERIDRNVDKKYFQKSKNSEKNKSMILGIDYVITKLKTKIVVIPRSCFNILNRLFFTRPTPYAARVMIIH